MDVVANEAGVVAVPVRFDVDDTAVAGELFLPAGHEAGSALPGVVCAGT